MGPHLHCFIYSPIRSTLFYLFLFLFSFCFLFLYFSLPPFLYSSLSLILYFSISLFLFLSFFLSLFLSFSFTWMKQQGRMCTPVGRNWQVCCDTCLFLGYVQVEGLFCYVGGGRRQMCPRWLHV